VEPKAVTIHLAAYLDRRDALVRFFTLRTGSSAMAEDVVQDIFLKLQAMSPEAAAEVRQAVPFLYRLGSNLLLDRLKQQRRQVARDDAWRRVESDEVGGEDAAAVPSAEDAAHARLKLDRVVAALDGLSPNCRRAFQLYKLEGLSQSDTATAMGISRSAVEKHVSTAVKHLLRKVGWP
jgi:RNA polymerase sigma factor (sigma-70 family)